MVEIAKLDPELLNKPSQRKKIESWCKENRADNAFRNLANINGSRIISTRNSVYFVNVKNEEKSKTIRIEDIHIIKEDAKDESKTNEGNFPCPPSPPPTVLSIECGINVEIPRRALKAKKGQIEKGTDQSDGSNLTAVDSDRSMQKLLDDALRGIRGATVSNYGSEDEVDDDDLDRFQESS